MEVYNDSQKYFLAFFIDFINIFYFFIGALVSDIHVLTAAHCTRDAKKNLYDQF